jgi:cytochrome c-type biogenesis protein CcmE
LLLLFKGSIASQIVKLKSITMKLGKIQIVAGVLVIAAIVLLVLASRDMSKYATFEDAAGSETEVKIVGVLSKDKEMYYDPMEDPNYFTFFMKDADGVEQKVLLRNKKPQDFELSEQLVITGKFDGDMFLATDMLMKCPSKYKDEEIYIKSAQTTYVE